MGPNLCFTVGFNKLRGSYYGALSSVTVINIVKYLDATARCKWGWACPRGFMEAIEAGATEMHGGGATMVALWRNHGCGNHSPYQYIEWVWACCGFWQVQFTT